MSVAHNLILDQNSTQEWRHADYPAIIDFLTRERDTDYRVREAVYLRLAEIVPELGEGIVLRDHLRILMDFVSQPDGCCAEGSLRAEKFLMSAISALEIKMNMPQDPSDGSRDSQAKYATYPFPQVLRRGWSPA
jgi:hypothetical protein